MDVPKIWKIDDYFNNLKFWVKLFYFAKLKEINKEYLIQSNIANSY